MPDDKDNEASADSDDSETAPPRSSFRGEPCREDEEDKEEAVPDEPFDSSREAEETPAPF
ncbi:hypothetical protein [Caballeronia sp. LjRoot31]|uniref:hypothetical protein n=1 Tax=Caballeronia sp. LjRoot31 TaxID=3342324 RepID=UPI003ECF819A